LAIHPFYNKRRQAQACGARKNELNFARFARGRLTIAQRTTCVSFARPLNVGNSSEFAELCAADCWPASSFLGQCAATARAKLDEFCTGNAISRI
jgi:hypothetical protein